MLTLLLLRISGAQFIIYMLGNRLIRSNLDGFSIVKRAQPGVHHKGGAIPPLEALGC